MLYQNRTVDKTKVTHVVKDHKGKLYPCGIADSVELTGAFSEGYTAVQYENVSSVVVKTAVS